MKLDKNSKGTVAIVYTLSLVVSLLVLNFASSWWIKIPVVLIAVWFSLWQTMFHMVPNRHRAGADDVVASVSDGRVVIIDKVYEQEWLKKECMMVSIYMDFWDFHANFWPVNGEVTYTMYHPGKHILAFKPKASEENEHQCTAIRTKSGAEVFFKQLAGGFARRIVCYAKEGMRVEAGSQCGIIKFGSRIDIYLPLDAKIDVKLGDLVKAQETVIAHLV